VIFAAKDNVLTPVNNAAKAWLDGKEGNVDLLPISQAKRRSLDANAKYWQWCGIIERENGYNPGEAHRLHKWWWGLAILTRKHPEYRDRLLAMLREMEYTKRLEAMDLITCTSQFSQTEFAEFMDAVQRYWAQQGIVLE